jgi:hypothetical protein
MERLHHRQFEDPGVLVDAPVQPSVRRKRGRPLLMSRESVIERIRQMSARGEGIYRTHLTQPALYARARRMFGSWSSAVAAAGLDYGATVERARSKSLVTRRQQRAR